MRAAISMILVLTLCGIVLGQTTIPNGTLYQSAAMNGIPYIAPDIGQQLIEQRAGLSWQSIANGAMGSGTITAALMGLTRTISLSNPWVVGLTVGHTLWDSYGNKVLNIAVPNPAALLNSLLQPDGVLILDKNCAHGMMLARTFKGSKVVGPVVVDGADVTFSPQASAVMRTSAGATIKGVSVWSVIVCPTSAITRTVNQIYANPPSSKLPVPSFRALGAGASDLPASWYKTATPVDSDLDVVADLTPEQRQLAMRIYAVHQEALVAVLSSK